MESAGLKTVTIDGSTRQTERRERATLFVVFAVGLVVTLAWIGAIAYGVIHLVL